MGVRLGSSFDCKRRCQYRGLLPSPPEGGATSCHRGSRLPEGGFWSGVRLGCAFVGAWMSSRSSHRLHLQAEPPPATGALGSRREAFGRAGVAGKALCKSAEAQKRLPRKREPLLLHVTRRGTPFVCRDPAVQHARSVLDIARRAQTSSGTPRPSGKA